MIKPIEIPLTRGKIALICPCHAYIAEGSKWCFIEGGYAVATRKQKMVYLHRLVANAQKGQQIDHKDMNKLNNRCSNLRVCNYSQNSSNRTLIANSRSGYKGVHWESRRNHWVARIQVNGHQFQLGSFIDKKEAASAYDLAASKYHGEFALTNAKLAQLLSLGPKLPE